MNKKQQCFDNIILLFNISKKLDFVKNELIPFYGKSMTLEDVEAALQEQYTKYQNIVNSYFE